MNHAVIIKNKGLASVYMGREQSKSWLNLIPVIMLLLVTALSLVYVKDLNRRLFMSYQQQHLVRRNVNVLWGQLLLEQSTWSTQQRIQSIAQHNLKMVMPNPAYIIMIK